MLRCAPGSLVCLCVSPFSVSDQSVTRFLISGAYSYARDAIQRYGGDAVVGVEDPTSHLAFTWKAQGGIIQIQAPGAELTWNMLVPVIGTLEGWLRNNHYQNCHFTILNGATQIAEGIVRKLLPFEL